MKINDSKNEFIFNIGIFFLPLVFFAKVLVKSEVLYWGTTSLQFFPWMDYAIRQVVSGSMPLWNPYNGMGAPFLANYQSAIFYPLNWLLLLFHFLGDLKGMIFGYTILLIVHLQIAAFGMKRLLKEINVSWFGTFIGIICFIFSGYVLARVNFISMIWAYSWLPWIIYRVVKLARANVGGFDKDIRNIGILGILIALQLFSGHAQTVFYSLIIATLFVVLFFGKNIKQNFVTSAKYGASILVGVLMSAIQLIPTAEYLMNSQRSAEVGYDYAVNFSFWPLRIFGAIFGDFWGNPGVNRFIGGGNFWEDRIYLGVFPIFFVLSGFYVFLRKRNCVDKLHQKIFCFGLVTIPFSIMLALGRNFFLFPFLYKFIPFFDLFQAPSRFLLWYTFAISLIAALGAEIWLKHSFSLKRLRLMIFLFIILAIFFSLGNLSMKIVPWNMVISVVIGSSLAVLWGLITISYQAKKHKYLFQTVIIVLLLFDLYFFNFPYSLFVSSEYYDRAGTMNQQMKFERVLIDQESENFIKFQRNFRFDRYQALENRSIQNTFGLPNTNLFNSEYAMVNNFDPFVPEKYQDFQDWMFGLSNTQKTEVLPEFGVTKMLSKNEHKQSGLDIKEIKGKNIVQWYDCALGLSTDGFKSDNPYNYFTRMQVQECISIGEPFEIISEDMSQGNHTAIVTFDRINGNQIFISYESDHSGWVLIRELDYPGWKAVIDNNQLVSIMPANFVFKAIQVPAGKHEVLLTYRPLSFSIGLVVSVVTNFLILITIFTKSIYKLIVKPKNPDSIDN